MRQEIIAEFYKIEDCQQSASEQESKLASWLGTDPVFGRLYKKSLKTLFDLKKLATFKSILRNAIKQNDRTIVVFGTGAALSGGSSGGSSGGNAVTNTPRTPRNPQQDSDGVQ